MASPREGVWSGAARRMRPGWVLLQLIGNGLLALGALGWLHIPDSHGWQFAFSVLAAFVLVAAFVWIYVTSMRGAHQPDNCEPYWRAGGWLLAGLVVSLLWMHAISGLGDKVELRAGYWNSQLSAHMRTLLTYPRLVEYQNAAITALSWLLPLLLLPIVIELVTRGWDGSVIRGTRVWRRWQFWVVAIVALFAGRKLTSALVDWHPTYTVRGEVLSVAFRLATAYGIDILLACAVLAVTCELLSQTGVGKSARRDAAA